MKAGVWAIGLLLAAASAAAPCSVDRVGLILQQQREIREESERSLGAYSRFDRDALNRMQGAQDRIFHLLEGVASIEQLSRDQQVELFNALETVKAVIADNEGSRQKCWREHKLGTTLKQTRCATMDELEQIRRGAEHWKGEPTICGSRGNQIDCGGNARSIPGSR